MPLHYILFILATGTGGNNNNNNNVRDLQTRKKLIALFLFPNSQNFNLFFLRIITMEEGEVVEVAVEEVRNLILLQILVLLQNLLVLF